MNTYKSIIARSGDYCKQEQLFVYPANVHLDYLVKYFSLMISTGISCPVQILKAAAP